MGGKKGIKRPAGGVSPIRGRDYRHETLWEIGRSGVNLLEAGDAPFASTKRNFVPFSQTLMLLHTWNQELGHHPHLHAVVPGGGPSLDDESWGISHHPSESLPGITHDFRSPTDRTSRADGTECSATPAMRHRDVLRRKADFLSGMPQACPVEPHVSCYIHAAPQKESSGRPRRRSRLGRTEMRIWGPICVAKSRTISRASLEDSGHSQLASCPGRLTPFGQGKLCAEDGRGCSRSRKTSGRNSCESGYPSNQHGQSTTLGCA